MKSKQSQNIKFRIITLFCLFSFSLELSSFSVIRDDKKLYFLDTTCEEAKSSIKALFSWSQTIGEENECPIETLPPVNYLGECGYEITTCAPKRLVKYHGAYSNINGPNCWNLALNISNILPALRYSSPEEMSFYMSSLLCRPLENGEQRQPGDIGAIRDVMFGGVLEAHGFVYITDNLVYSKNEYFSSIGYELLGLDEVYTHFSVPINSECRQNQIDLNGTCERAVSFFRCNSFNQYLSSLSNLPNNFKLVFEGISRFEIYFEKTNMAGDRLEVEVMAELILEVEKFVKSLGISLKKQDLSEDEFFLISNVRWRVFSLSEQLGMTFHIRENQRLLDLSLRIYRYLKTKVNDLL